MNSEVDVLGKTDARTHAEWREALDIFAKGFHQAKDEYVRQTQDTRVVTPEPEIPISDSIQPSTLEEEIFRNKAARKEFQLLFNSIRIREDPDFRTSVEHIFIPLVADAGRRNIPLTENKLKTMYLGAIHLLHSYTPENVETGNIQRIVSEVQKR